MLYRLLKSVLFTLPPEKAHDLTLKLAHLSPILGQVSGVASNPRLSVTVGKNQWRFPIGLAAGLDKNAEALDFFEGQGFGAIECGTITLRPQAGNPLPRLFRYIESESLRNSMGFPNQGMLNILPRLRAYAGATPTGINIGKNKESLRVESIEELSLMTATLSDVADYFVINVSSPNTPGLRDFQERGYLQELFQELKTQAPDKDLYLKIAPDLEVDKVEELVSVASGGELTGLIATNTTIIPERGAGGVSGKLLNEKARTIRNMILQMNPNLELIGVGGVSHFSDLLEFWSRGGKVMQVYTSYVFQGPGLLHHFHSEIEDFLSFQKLFLLQDFLNLPLEEKNRRIHEYSHSR